MLCSPSVEMTVAQVLNTIGMIRFGHTFVVLDIDSWVTLPGHPVNAMTGASLPWSPEVVVTNTTEVFEAYSSGIVSHLS